MASLQNPRLPPKKVRFISQPCIHNVSPAPSIHYSPMPDSYDHNGVSGKWKMLLVVSCGAIFSGLSFTFLSPIEDTVQEFYGVSDSTMLYFLYCYPALYLPSSIFTDWMIRKSGLRLVLSVAMCIQVAGAGIRWLGAIREVGYFPVVIAGQVIVAFAQCFYLNTPSYISTIWFSHEQRDLAVSLMYFFYSLGMTLGQLTSPLIIHDDDGEKIESLMAIHAVVGSGFLITTWGYAQDRPVVSRVRQMPMATSDFESTGSMFTEALDCMSVPYFWVLVMTLVFSQGINNALSLFTGDLARYLDQSNRTAGIWGTALNLGGITGFLIIGQAMDYVKYRELTIFKVTLNGYHLLVRLLCLVELSICVGFFFLCRPSTDIWALASLFFLFGACAFSLIVLATQAAVEVCFPVSEITPVATLRIMENYFSVAMGISISTTLPDHYSGYCPFHFLLVGASCVTFIFGWIYLGPMRRTRSESQLE